MGNKKVTKYPFKIPARFQLFGHTIEVEWQDTLIDKSNNSGQARYREYKILLQSGDERHHNRPDSDREQVFCHELVHWILSQMNDDKYDNEVFVDVFASLLHQALTTMEHDN